MNQHIVAGLLAGAVLLVVIGVALQWTGPIALLTAGPLVAVWALFAIREIPEPDVAAHPTDES